MPYNQDDDLNEGPIVVRRPVYDAGVKLEDDVKAGASGQLSRQPGRKVHECQAAGNAAAPLCTAATILVAIIAVLR